MEEKILHGKRFIEGKGWEVLEGPRPQATPVHLRPAQVNLSAAPREELEKAASALNLVMIDGDEYRELLERNRELENLLDRAGSAVAAVKDQPVAVPKKTARKGASIEEQITATDSLEELSALMHDVQDPIMLKLADARAEQIQRGDP